MTAIAAASGGDENTVCMNGIVLKREQMEAIDAFLGGKDVMAVLPTGFGKSMIYQSFIRIKDSRSEDSSDNYSTSCLVIVPL